MICIQGKSMLKPKGFNRNSKWNITGIGDYITNIDQLEELTGIDFFCNLPDNIEEHVESQHTDNIKRAWGLK